MADISIFKISGGVSDSKTTSGITSGAASQTIPHSGKDSRLALRVANGNESQEAVVCIEAADGPRAALGDMKVTVEAGKTVYIALFDTARYKDLTTGKITVDITGVSGSTLTEQQLTAVRIEAVQM